MWVQWRIYEIILTRLHKLEVSIKKSLPSSFCPPSDAPICRVGQVQRYNVGRGETAQIACEVEGIPRDIEFVWKFNTSVHEVLDMPSSSVKSNGTRSVIHFKPMTEHVRPQWKSLNCKFLLMLTDNFLHEFCNPFAGLRYTFVLGQQRAWHTEGSVRFHNHSGGWVNWILLKVWCKFATCNIGISYEFTNTGKPDPLTNCSVFNQTSESFQVACVEGYNGGLQQEFAAQANLLGHSNAVGYVNSKWVVMHEVAVWSSEKFPTITFFIFSERHISNSKASMLECRTKCSLLHKTKRENQARLCCKHIPWKIQKNKQVLWHDSLTLASAARNLMNIIKN